MKIIVLRNNLKNALDAVSRTIEDNLNLPILKNIFIRADQSKITIASTNLEAAITKIVPGKITEQGEVTVPFNLLNSLINNLQSERIDLEAKKNNLFLKTDNYEATIQGMNPSDFPIIPKITPESGSFNIPAAVLKEGINKIINACQISDLRPEISGILFNFETNVFKLVATDSFRLAEKTIPETQFKSNSLKVKKTIIPLKTIQELVRVLDDEDDVHIFIDDSQALFKTESLEIITRLIDGQFPDYGPIIPKILETEIVIDKQELVNAMKLAGSFTARSGEVIVKVGDDKKIVEVYSADSGLGENKYLISAKINGDPVKASFNWKYLLDGLKNIYTDTVLFGLQGDSRPAIIKAPNDTSYFYILMPIKD
ncbi:MAG: DNA polymerase III subunit beta [Patescibacteria group bacterium]|nr:DNA polymerase III subunit beta [Patescibacteria group bacterium]MCL5262165.1 DNA polymerase III subunit beta [Patescibacteria group bacterium]